MENRRAVVLGMSMMMVVALSGWETSVDAATRSGSRSPSSPRAANPARADVWTAVTVADQVLNQASSTCAIRTDSTLWCWGLNDAGQLGLGDSRDRLKPFRVGANTDWAEVSAGWDDACAVKAAGTLWCWGKAYSSTPTQVGNASTWTSVSVGDGFRCAVRRDDTLWCWGKNDQGQLGVGDTTYRTDPTEVGNGSDWTQVATGDMHACAVRAEGSLWCWGAGPAGQLGLGDDQLTALSPTQVGTNSLWVEVSAANATTCAVRDHHSGWCWGANDHGQLGTGDATRRTVPTQVLSAETWASLTAGGQHTCGVRTDGTLWCWGANDRGQLGTGSQQDADYPVQVGSGHAWTQAGAGAVDSCAVQSDNTLWCWGAPDSGELGVGNRTSNTRLPVQVGLPDDGGQRLEFLAAVDAVSADDVWAVGHSKRGAPTHTLIQHFDGTSWARVSSPNPGSQVNQLLGVSALGPDDAWAVGTHDEKGVNETLVEHWNGTRWSVTPSPNKSPYDNTLTSVAAISAADVWAVGWNRDGYEPLIEHWDGTSWKIVAADEGDFSYFGFASVTAISPTNVWAVGSGFVDEEAGWLTITEHWDGQAWKIRRTEHRNRFSSHYLRGVSAAGSGDVWAVGDENRGSALIEHWNGKTWVKLGHLPNTGVTRLNAVFAEASDDVWAVGGAGGVGLILHRDAHRWSAVPAPRPPGSELLGVNAIAPDDAWAVGVRGGGSSLIEHWDGTAWSIARGVSP